MRHSLITSILFLFNFPVTLGAQIYLTPSSQNWYGNETDGRTVTVHSSGYWDVDSLNVGGHGYTGHEYLPGWGLINANAWLYDPALARFLSPDPLVQDPAGTQNFTRYTYCLNNPLKYTDESGMLFGVDDLILAAITGAAGGSYVGGGSSYLGASIAMSGMPFANTTSRLENKHEYYTKILRYAKQFVFLWQTNI